MRSTDNEWKPILLRFQHPTYYTSTQRWYPERHALPLPTCLLPSSPPTTGHHHHQQQPTRAATLSRAAVASLGLLRPSLTDEENEGMRLLADGGEARLYATCGSGPDDWVRKAHHKHAAGKALKELQALLAAGAHAAADDDDDPPSPPSSPLPLVGLRGVEWPLDSARPTALLLERASGDLRSLLLAGGGQKQPPPTQPHGQQQRGGGGALPFPQVLKLALGLALAAARLHNAGLCHRDIHR